MELWRAQLGRGSVDAFAFAPHGMTVVAACDGDPCNVVAADSNTGRVFWQLVPTIRNGVAIRNAGPFSLAFAPDSAIVVASAGEGILLTIDAIMGTIHTEVTIGPPDVHCVAFAPSGRAMATRMYTCQVDGVPQVSNWPTVGTWGWMVLKLSLWSPKMSTLISESDSAGSLHEGESNRR